MLIAVIRNRAYILLLETAKRHSMVKQIRNTYDSVTNTGDIREGQKYNAKIMALTSR